MADESDRELLLKVLRKVSDVEAAVKQYPSQLEQGRLIAIRVEGAADRAERAAATIGSAISEVRAQLREETDLVARVLADHTQDSIAQLRKWWLDMGVEIDRLLDQRLTPLEGSVKALALVVEGLRSVAATTIDQVKHSQRPGSDDDDEFSQVEGATMR